MSDSGSPSVADTQEIDAGNTVEDWRILGLEVLQLKCNTYGIQATGRTKTLAHKLFKHFHPPDSDEDEVSDVGSAATDTATEEPKDNAPLVEHRADNDDRADEQAESDIDREIAALKMQTAMFEAQFEGEGNGNDVPLDQHRNEVDAENDGYVSPDISLPGSPNSASREWMNEKPTSHSSERSARESDDPPRRTKRPAQVNVSPSNSPAHRRKVRRKTRSSRTKGVPAPVSKPVTNQVNQSSFERFMKELEDQRQSQKIRDLEVRALRSELSSLKKSKTTIQTTKHTIPNAPIAAVDSTQRSKRKTKSPTKKSSPIKRKARTHASSSRGVSTGNNVNYSNLFHSAPKSMMAAGASTTSFPPPPIKKELMDLIKKEEYVNFNKLKPKNFSRKANDERNRKIEATYNEQGGIEFKSSRSETINNFAEWMEAWNLYLAARLHFDFNCFKVLFGYQTQITNLMVKYNFDAVYTYDIAFRHAMAAERTIPPRDRVRKWSKLNEDLANYHLKEEQKAPLVCFWCQEEGHLANRCDLKKSHQKAKKGQQHLQVPPLMHLNPFNSTPRFPTPPPPPPSRPPGFRSGGRGNNPPRQPQQPQQPQQGQSIPPCRRWESAGACRWRPVTSAPLVDQERMQPSTASGERPPASDQAVPKLPPFMDLPLSAQNQYVNISNLKHELKNYHDQGAVNNMLVGLQHGFDIGFRGQFSDTFPQNNSSASKNAELVSKSINKEVERGHTAGPFTTTHPTHNHISTIGAAIKSDGSARLIMDLSHPSGSSVNDSINKEEFPTNYVHFDVATTLVRKMGRGCFLSKIDIKHAFRILPVRPEDWPLLVYFWEGHYYVDLKLPFGGRSSPSIFTNFADLLCWILTTNYKLVAIHYADDYLLFTIPCLLRARENLEILLQVFEFLGIPVALDKLVGPATVVIYLGIQINTMEFTISIPSDKMEEMLSLLPKWCSRRTCKKRKLLSLIGKLNFCATVVRSGRLFVRRLIDLSTTVTEMHHYVTLNAEAKDDIHWWCEFLPQWNCHSIIPDPLVIKSTDIKLFTDAAKTIGFGALMDKAWIQSVWPPHLKDADIDYKELFAIMAATLTWGSSWSGKRIVFVTDNKPITQIWSSGTTSSSSLMNIIRKLFLFAASHDFSISFKHIYGHFNEAADALSRFQVQRFRSLVPDADSQPTPLPPQVWEVGNHLYRHTACSS